VFAFGFEHQQSNGLIVWVEAYQEIRVYLVLHPSLQAPIAPRRDPRPPSYSIASVEIERHLGLEIIEIFPEYAVIKCTVERLAARLQKRQPGVTQRNVCRVALDKFEVQIIERGREKLEDDIAGLNLLAKCLFGGGLGLFLFGGGLGRL